MNLWQDFQNSGEGKIVNKWTHYFPIYEKHLLPWRNKSINFLEIGVSQGGSLQIWQRFFGPMARVVGIDINPDCAKHAGPGIEVRIGDQSDPAFLGALIDEFGPFDIVIDDGSHQMEHVIKTFEFLYPRISKNGLYIVEDLHTAYWPEFGGGLENPDTFVNISKEFVDRLNAHHSRGALTPDFMTENTLGISFYDSVIVFERGNFPLKTSPVIGKPDMNYRIARMLPKPLHPVAKKIKRVIF